MADSDKPTHEVAGATPPGRGEQTHEPIPGERDPSTLTAREPGAMGTFSGAELPRADARASLSDDDIEQLRRDGGGLAHTHKQ